MGIQNHIPNPNGSRGPGRMAGILLQVMLAGMLAFSGCSGDQPQQVGAPVKDDLNRKGRFRTRPPINTTRNLYEGSLWQGANSWGNLMRDHRARYRGDLLTISDVVKIINVPEARVDQLKPQEPAQAQPEQTEEVDPVIAYLQQQQKKREMIEREQNEILRAIESIEVEVVRVLPNGNLLVKGVHPPIFRDRNRVKYVVSLQGIVRPSDVDDKNTIPAPKLSKADYKIRRLVRRTALEQQLFQSTKKDNRSKDSVFLDRLSSFLLKPKKQ